MYIQKYKLGCKFLTKKMPYYRGDVTVRHAA